MSKVEKTDVEWSITVDGACINQNLPLSAYLNKAVVDPRERIGVQTLPYQTCDFTNKKCNSNVTSTKILFRIH